MSIEWLSTGLVARISGASPRQLDYWVIRGLLNPSGQPTPKGKWRAYSLADAMVATAIKSLRDQGVSLQHIRDALAQLQVRLEGKPEPHQVLKKSKLLAYGGKVYVRRTSGPAHRAIDGQTTFLFVDFERVYDQVAHGVETHLTGIR